MPSGHRGVDGGEGAHRATACLNDASSPKWATRHGVKRNQVNTTSRTRSNNPGIGNVARWLKACHYVLFFGRQAREPREAGKVSQPR